LWWLGGRRKPSADYDAGVTGEVTGGGVDGEVERVRDGFGERFVEWGPASVQPQKGGMQRLQVQFQGVC